MSVKSRPEVVFKRSGRTKASGKSVRNVIASGDEVAAAFEELQRHPMWREDRRLSKITPAISKEILTFYNAVIADGRFVADFQDDPAEVAKKLNAKISKEALAVVSAVTGNRRGASSMSVVGAAVVISISVVAAAVATAIVSWQGDPRQQIIIDESGKVKLGERRANVATRAKAKAPATKSRK